MSSFKNNNTPTDECISSKNDTEIDLKTIDKINLPIYLDYQATTPMDIRVFEEMKPYLLENFGNPSSVNHVYGKISSAAVELSKEKIANLIKCDRDEIIITSGATESNNLAIKGYVEYFLNKYKCPEGETENICLDKKIHIITLEIEHNSVLNTFKFFKENENVEITILPVKKDGIVDLKLLEKTIRKNTRFISVMHINNVIGTIQPIKKIGEICRKNRIIFHTDAAQSFGKIPIDVNKMNIDMMSISGHKIYGPKGIGALYIKREHSNKISRQIIGGGQQGKLRSGTIPTPLVVGLGKAAEIAKNEMESNFERVEFFRMKILEKISENKKISNKVSVNGDFSNAFPGCLNICLKNIDREKLNKKLAGFAFSFGSACGSLCAKPSYVLKSLGMTDVDAKSSIRIGFGRNTKINDIDKFIEKLFEVFD